MREIVLEQLDTKVYIETLENGLEIYLVPDENKKNYFLTYATKFGSDVVSFELDDKKYTPPLGIAHYLEHKVFEEESGIDPFTFFSESGTNANAMTTYDSTKYICIGTKKFRENLRYLLKYVNSPYFTDENVEKERGIITEEIKMYSDIPDYKLETKLRQNIYKNSPRKNDIAGSIKEINKITKEDLYNCYNSFYIPNNMFILILGNFNINDALEVIKEELKNKTKEQLPKIYEEEEPIEVVKKEQTIKDNIAIPKIGLGVKISTKDIGMNKTELDLYLHILTTIMFGSSSEFRERLRVDNILNDIYTEWETINDIKTFYLYATTTKPDELINEINYEFENKTITTKHFERIKKVWIANEVKLVDNIERLESNLYDDIIRYNEIINNRIELIRKMDIKKLNKILKQINFENKSVLKVLCNDKK